MEENSLVKKEVIRRIQKIRTFEVTENELNEFLEKGKYESGFITSGSVLIGVCASFLASFLSVGTANLSVTKCTLFLAVIISSFLLSSILFVIGLIARAKKKKALAEIFYNNE